MVTRAIRLAAIATLAFLTACGRPAAGPTPALGSVSVVDADGHVVELGDVLARAPFTVVTFFSAHCPCQLAHDERLRALHAAYGPREVQFVAIDAEVGASPARAAREAASRHYGFPLLADAKGATADALSAESATHTVLLDRSGRVLYAGGIDSDRTHLTNDAQRYLKDALDDALASRAVRVAHGEALGCALQR